MPRLALVVNPWVADFKLYDEWMHPLGLYFLISLLEHNGFDVRFFNCLQPNPLSKSKKFSTGHFEVRHLQKPALFRDVKRTYKLYGQSPEAFSALLTSINPPDAIFFGSGMTYWLPGLVETMRFVGQFFPRTTIVVGGPSARLIPEHIGAAVPGAHVFRGSLFDRQSLGSSGVPVLSGLQCDGWEPSLSDAYRHLPFMRHGPVLSSIGCPASCSYCASKALHGIFSQRRTGIVVSEIEYLYERRNVSQFAFFDDALLHLPEKNFIPLMNAVIDRGLTVNFHTPNGLQVRGLSAEICGLMKRAGFRTIRLGYESGEARYAGDTCAKAPRTQLKRAVGMFKEGGFRESDIGVYVMAGLPGQSPADVLAEIDFVASLNVNVKPVFLSPVPRTRLFEEYRGHFPQLAADPLWHNDSFFISQLPGWDGDAVQRVADAAKENNARIDNTHT
jgi:hypothetical protein